MKKLYIDRKFAKLEVIYEVKTQTLDDEKRKFFAKFDQLEKAAAEADMKKQKEMQEQQKRLKEILERQKNNRPITYNVAEIRECHNESEPKN